MTAASVLRRTFGAWQSDGTRLAVQMSENPSLQEGAQLGSDLKTLGMIGLETLQYRMSGETAPDEWHDAALKSLEEIAKPKAACEFAVVDAMKKLVNSASKVSTDQ